MKQTDQLGRHECFHPTMLVLCLLSNKKESSIVVVYLPDESIVKGRCRQRLQQDLGVLCRGTQSDERDGRVPHRNLNRRGR